MGDRAYKLKSRYGITESVYNDILRGQQYCCKICRAPHKEHSKLHVDHQIDSKGKPWILGLLCGKCNATLAMSRHSVEVLEACVEYLNRR